MLNTVHHDHLEGNGKSSSTDENRLRRTMATKTAAYREKKNCSGLSVMVLNVFDIAEEPRSIPSVCTIMSHLASSITARQESSGVEMPLSLQCEMHPFFPSDSNCHRGSANGRDVIGGVYYASYDMYYERVKGQCHIERSTPWGHISSSHATGNHIQCACTCRT